MYIYREGIKLGTTVGVIKGDTRNLDYSNNHILAQNLYYNYYYPNSKYLVIGYMDPKP